MMVMVMVMVVVVVMMMAMFVRWHRDTRRCCHGCYVFNYRRNDEIIRPVSPQYPVPKVRMKGAQNVAVGQDEN